MYSGIVAVAFLIVSIFIPLIPCRTAPGIPSPIYKWTLCSLNPDKVTSLGSITEFFGYTTSLRDAYILTLLITFVVAMVFLHYLTRRKKKNQKEVKHERKQFSRNESDGIIIWIVGVIVALAVGSSMIDRTLSIPGIPGIITAVAGWVVVVGAILSVILAIFSR